MRLLLDLELDKVEHLLVGGTFQGFRYQWTPTNYRGGTSTTDSFDFKWFVIIAEELWDFVYGKNRTNIFFNGITENL